MAGHTMDTGDQVSCTVAEAALESAGAEAFCDALVQAVAAASSLRYDLQLTRFSNDELAIDVQDLERHSASGPQTLYRRMLDLDLQPEMYPEFATQVVRAAIRQGTITGR